MAKTVNKVILLGNIGRSPEMKTSSNGTLRMTASLATSDRRKVEGEWKEFTEWHNLVFFGRLAEIGRDYITKGSKIYVEGHLHTYSYDDESNTKRYRTDVVVDELSLISGTKGPAQSQAAAAQSDEGVPF